MKDDFQSSVFLQKLFNFDYIVISASYELSMVYLSNKYQRFQKSNILIKKKMFLSINKNYAAMITENTCNECKKF